MARGLTSTGQPRRRWLSVVILVLLGFTFVPPSVNRVVQWFGDLTATAIAPVSHPFSAFARWIAPARIGAAPPAEIQAIEEELARTKLLHRRSEQRAARLEQLIERLQGGLAVIPDVPMSLLAAPVVAASADLSSEMLTIRAGANQGVAPGAVAVADAVQLVGRVETVAPALSRVRPITDPTAGLLRARIELDGAGSSWLLTQLGPDGDGTLSGPVAIPDGATPEAVRAEPGMTVRLDDPEAWPGAAQALVVGAVESVSPDPDQPQRQVVVVRPTVRLERISEVVLRIPRATDASDTEFDSDRGGTP
ncbi:MAG: rod shape-determining protein MreC [Planctomycetota bacterium]